MNTPLTDLALVRVALMDLCDDLPETNRLRKTLATQYERMDHALRYFLEEHDIGASDWHKWRVSWKNHGGEPYWSDLTLFWGSVAGARVQAHAYADLHNVPPGYEIEVIRQIDFRKESRRSKPHAQ